MAQQDDKELRLALAQARRWAALDEVMTDNAVSALLATNDGRKFLWWILEIGKVNTQPFSTDSLKTAFACGELNVGQQILDRLLRVNAAGYLNMLQEHQNEQSSRDALGHPDSSDTPGSDAFDPAG